MPPSNCWEYKKCGREPGGANEAQLGVCPAATDTSANGVNHGTNAGRICWAVAGTICSGKVEGTFAEKQVSCLTCDFYRLVKSEEGSNFVRMKLPLMQKKTA